MKRFLSLLLVISLFMFGGVVNAATMKWDKITANFKDYLEDIDSYEVIADDKTLEIIYKSDNNVEETDETNVEKYTTTINYENGIISLKPVDKTGYTDFQKAMKSMLDSFLIETLIIDVATFYDVDPSKVFDEEKLLDYGITLQTEEITYEEGNSTVTVSDIKNFIFDLNKFEANTKDLVGTYDDSQIGDFSNPEVSLLLEKANSDSLDLIIEVKGLSEDSDAVCYVYFRNTVDGVTTDGKLAGTINDCVNGQNKLKISDLNSDKDYEFGIELKENFLGDEITLDRGDNVSFKTIKNVSENIDNPNTGNYMTIFLLIMLTLSCLSTALFITKKYNFINQ